MGNFFEEDDDDPVDLAAVEARHAEMEAEAEVERLETESASAGQKTAEDWEAIIEAVLFTMGNSVELKQLAVAIGQSEDIAKRVVLHLQKRYEEEKRGMRILELENAYQMCTCADYYENLIQVAATPKKHVMTDVIMETLSIIAYRQPVTKMEIGKIRGVNSDHAVNRLVEYGLVYEAGRLDAPGRPALFATTEEFLRRFGVSSMVDLPTMNPEQEEEIIQEVEEELQMKLGAQGEADGSTPESVSEVVEEVLKEREGEEIFADSESDGLETVETEYSDEENEEKEESDHAEDQN